MLKILFTCTAAFIAITATQTQEAQACSCAFPVSSVEAIYPKSGMVPKDSKGIVVIAKHWPRNVKVMPKSVLKHIKVTRQDGKKSVSVPFEVVYLGTPGKPPSGIVITTGKNLKTLKPLKKFTPSSPDPSGVYQYMYLIKPKNGMKEKKAYTFNVEAPASRWQLSKEDRAAGKTTKTWTSTVTVASTTLKTPKNLITTKVVPSSVRMPAGASCSTSASVDATHLKFNVPKGFEDAFVYSIFKNGQLWRPATSLCSQFTVGRYPYQKAPNEALVFEKGSCETKTVTLKVLATMPGSNLTFWSKAIKTNLGCAQRMRRRIRLPGAN